MHADEVVRVHDGVDEAVEHDSQVNVAVVAGVHVHPVELRQAQEDNKCENGSELGTNKYSTRYLVYIYLVLTFFTADEKRIEPMSRFRHRNTYYKVSPPRHLDVG